MFLTGRVELIGWRRRLFRPSKLGCANDGCEMYRAYLIVVLLTSPALASTRAAQKPPDVSKLFAQLNQANTTDRAARQILEVASRYPDVRQYIVKIRTAAFRVTDDQQPVRDIANPKAAPATAFTAGSEVVSGGTDEYSFAELSAGEAATMRRGAWWAQSTGVNASAGNLATVNRMCPTFLFVCFDQSYTQKYLPCAGVSPAASRQASFQAFCARAVPRSSVKALR